MPYQQKVLSKVAGTTFRNITKQMWEEIPKQKLTLRREPDNDVDPNAIMVCCGPHHTHIGYIKAELAADLAGIIDDGVVVNISNHYITGADDPTINNGINLEILIDYTDQMKATLEKHYKPLQEEVF